MAGTRGSFASVWITIQLPRLTGQTFSGTFGVRFPPKARYFFTETSRLSSHLINWVNQSHYRSGQAERVLRKLRFPDFVTTARDDDRLSALRTGLLYPRGITPGTHFC